MNKIEQMLQALCPNGVRYLSLGECIEIYTGIQFNKRDMSEVGTYPVLNGGINPSGFSEKYNEEKDTITISQGGASAGYVNWMDCKFWAGAHCFVVKPDNDILNNRYLYFLLKNSEQVLMQAKHGAGIPGLNRDKVKNLIMPIPPLPIQEEIVRILDHFTELTAELQAELQARQEQYEYYRNELLTFTKIGGGGTQSVTWMKMNEIGTFIRGNGLQKKDFTPTGIGCIHYGQIYTYYGTWADKTLTYCSPNLATKLKVAHKGDIIIATTSENVEDVCKAVAWLGDNDIVISGDAYIFSHNQNPKYISYLFQTHDFFNFKQKNQTGTKVIRISGESLAKYVVPIPSLSEQQRIVGILDKFETLVNDLSQGLPAEIAAVQEQYEYYRNKLLTFKRIA